jgi:serine/threonine protein phosphatase PrpC
VSKYYDQVFSSLFSYQNGLIEQALIETSFMLDNILKMDNVNQYLKTLKSLYDAELDLAFEFLKFSPLNNEVFNIRTCTEEFPRNKEASLESDGSSDEAKRARKDSTANVSPTEDSFDANTGKDDIDVQNLFPSKMYTFGGLVIDQHAVVDEKLLSYNMGTTANVVLLKNGYCYVSNAGDSLAVLYKGGKAYRLNVEHKTSLTKERDRIIKSGSIIFKDRVDGRLNLTRAIGDFMHKDNSKIGWEKQAVTCLPDISKFKVTSDMEFIVMGCDGIWECVDTQKFCEHISRKLQEKVPLNLILRDVLSIMLLKTDVSTVGMDNMTCILIQFTH